MEPSQSEQKQHTIDLEKPYDALEQPLTLVDSPERREDIQRYLQAARIHLERAAFVTFSELVEALNEADASRRVRLRYESGGLRFVIENRPQAEETGEGDSFFSGEGDLEKVTIRIPKELKQLIDEAATHAGRSANSWYIRELARSIRHSFRRGGGRGMWGPGGPESDSGPASTPPFGWRGPRGFDHRPGDEDRG